MLAAKDEGRRRKSCVNGPTRTLFRRPRTTVSGPTYARAGGFAGSTTRVSFTVAESFFTPPDSPLPPPSDGLLVGAVGGIGHARWTRRRLQGMRLLS